MPIQALQSRTPEQLRAEICSFAQKYVDDWNNWIEAGKQERPQLFGAILRRWQATRPAAMRRLRAGATHPGPFLDDLLAEAEPYLLIIGNLDVKNVRGRTAAQSTALHSLWVLFSRLPVRGTASCVGVTKAILLLTNGRIGPALDSKVRKQLRVSRPLTAEAWIQFLEEISDDIEAFEMRHGPLPQVVPEEFASIPRGRLYDMALGPR